MSGPRAAPRDCPVCGEGLALTRLSCASCGTELSGSFRSCDFCALSPEDAGVLRVFLASRGNMKDLERHLGVSYPTARARFDALVARLGIDRPAPAGTRLELLEQVSRGEVEVEEAMRRL